MAGDEETRLEGSAECLRVLGQTGVGGGDKGRRADQRAKANNALTLPPYHFRYMTNS